MICTYCKAENNEDCLYCPTCGKPTSAPVSTSVQNDAVPAIPARSEQALVTAGEALKASVSSLSLSEMPGSENVQLAQANLCRMRRNWAEATELCIAVLRVAPADQAAHSLLGDIYRDQGRLDDAVRWYKMALDLRPNPFDQANLQKIERKISSRKHAYMSASAGTHINPIDGSVAGGTSTLMGYAPQRWLKGITISALAFLGLFVLYLLFIPNKKIDTVPRPLPSESLVADPHSRSDMLPPAKLGGPTSLPAGEQASPGMPIGRAAGTGLPPDLGPVTVPTAQTRPEENSTSGVGVSPAPVRSVSPLTSGASQSGQVSVVTPGPGRITTHNNSLSGGMELSRVEVDHGTATILIVAGNGSNSATTREVMVRNLYRAARTVFSNDTSLQRASVSIRSGSLDGSALLSADIDRSSALAAEPDSEDLATLTSHLQVH